MKISKDEFDFLPTFSQAIMHKTPGKIKLILFFWFVTIIGFIIWANYAKIDEIVRGKGEVIPSGQNQKVQNLEGGIVEDIYVKEGDYVKKGQILLKIKNQKSISSLIANKAKLLKLKLDIIRLKAELANKKKLIYPKEIQKNNPELVANEISLFNSKKKELNFKINSLKQQLIQKQNELKTAIESSKSLKKSLFLIKEELKMTEPMVKQGVKSKIDLLKLQREVNDIKNRYITTKNSIENIKSAIKELQDKINAQKLQFQNEVKRKLTDLLTEYETYKASLEAYKDTVKRTLVKSPIDGIVQKLYVNTIGEVVKPGATLVEIVPVNEKLVIKTKIKPKDIGFIYKGQKAIVKFSAYDYSIYGGLKGKVIAISPDTVKDERGHVFYIVKVETEKNYLHNNKKLKIIPGMIATVDIITGKKTLMQYILKPILKTKEYSFSER